MLKNVLCPLCKSNKKKSIFNQKVWGGARNDKFLKCHNCDIVFLHPFPKNKQINDFYQHHYGNYMKKRSKEQEWSNLSKQFDILKKRDIPLRSPFLKKYLKKGNVCDVGSSTGFMIEYLIKQGRDVYGVEPSDEHRIFSEKKGYKIFKNMNEVNLKFDNVINYYVLEHVNKPINFIENLLNLLKKNGHLILEVPNREDFLLKQVNLKSYKDFILQKMHVMNYSIHSLRYLFDKFNIKYEILRGEKYSLDNHLNWLTYNKPGKVEMNISKSLKNNYNRMLIENNLNDYFIVVAKKF